MRLNNLFIVGLILISLASVSARVCELDVNLINQDPYPAVPGDYVELVFQVTGLVREGCGDITFELLPSYPIIFDPGQPSVQRFEELNYLKDYQSNLLIPYRVRVDSDALDGKNPIEVKVINRRESPMLKTFDLEVKDSRTDFEVYVKNYNYNNHQMTIEIINVGKADTEALTVEIPRQDIIGIKGSRRQVVGDLDSNDYTTAEFEATPRNGEFNILLTYSDSINVRRTVEHTVYFDSDYFTNRKADEVTPSYTWIYVVIAIVLFIVYIIYKRVSKAKAKKRRLANA